MSDSDAMPLNDNAPLTPDENRRLRHLLQEAERATWARKKLAVLTPMVVAVVVAMWQLVDWFSRHFKPIP